MKVAVLSNININILINDLKKDYDLYQGEGYGNFLEELMNSKSAFNDYKPDVTFIILDGNELIKSYRNIVDGIEDLKIAIEKNKEINPSNRIFVSNIDLKQEVVECKGRSRVRNLSNQWLEAIDNFRHVEVFDLLSLIEEEGRKTFYSATLWYLSSCPYSKEGIKTIGKEIKRLLNFLTTARKKCLVLDMDNTLWGGVLGEEGPLGIKCSPNGPDSCYYDFQRQIRKLKDLGIILTVVSKNNMADVEELYIKNQSMPLKKEDFTIIRANWERKAKNIREIAEELNIGLDSLVFIDDNPIEREQVKIELPEVNVVDFPDSIYKLNEFIEEIYKDYFFTLSITEEDKIKAKQYAENSQRNKEKSRFSSYEEYLEYLTIEVDLREVREDDIERAAQLTQKTNQFNLTTRRYTESDIKKMSKDENYKVLIGEAKDRFGDYGKIILAILELEEDKVIIDTFLMSCRIMGRNVEKTMLNYIENIAKDTDKSFVEALYIRSKKNKPAENFYKENCYTKIEESFDISKYIKKLGR